MSRSIVTLLYIVLILVLFWLDRHQRARALVARWLSWLSPTWLPVSHLQAVGRGLQSADREGARPTTALWLPVIWLSLAGSRSASEWLQLAPPGASTEALLEGDPINRVVYIGLFALGVMVLAFRGPRVLRLLEANGIIVLFLLYCLASLSWAEYPDVGFKRWVKVVGDFVMVLVVLSDRDPRVAIRRLLTRTGFLLLPLSVLLVKYYPDLARYYDRWDWETYYSGVTTNKNSLGVICLLFGLASVWQLLACLTRRHGARPGQRIIAHGMILVMVVWLLWIANSMTALACFLLGVSLLAALELPFIARQPMVVHVIVVTLIAVPSAVLFIGIEGVLEMMGKDPTLTDRTLIWDLLLTLTPNAWLGTGFENFWLGPRLEKIWSVYSWAPNQAHNGYLEVYLNLGWIGIGLVILVLLAGYQTVMTGLRQSSPIGSLMLAYFVVGIVYNFTEAALFRISAPAWFVLLLAICGVPDARRSQKHRAPGQHDTRRAVPITARTYGSARGQAVTNARKLVSNYGRVNRY